MYLTLTIISIILLILVYPIRINVYAENGIKARLQLLGFINIRINLRRLLRKFTGRKDTKLTKEEDDFSIIEILENYKKILSTREVASDMVAKMTVDDFTWYSAIPMNNEILGLALLPIYTTTQTYIIDFLYNNFNKVKDYDIDTKYNYKTDDIFIYLNCIISINLLKILTVSIKYIKKWPLLIKRAT